MNTLPLIRAVADGIMDLPFEAWHFGDSVAFEALVEASARTGDEKYLQFVRGFGRAWFATREHFEPLDCTAAGAALTTAASRTGDPILLHGLLRLATYLTKRPTIGGAYQTWARSPLREPYGPVPMTPDDRKLFDDPGPGVFVDCLHFDPPFFATLADATGDTEWRIEAVTQARSYIALLQDPISGLFHHFYLERTGRAHILGWGRGQGWALLGLLEVVALLPPGADRDALAESARSLVDGMLHTQRSDGHWDALIGDTASGVETSTAAFMAVGFERAAALGVVPRSEVQESIQRCLSALEAYVDSDGRLSEVSAAVWASTLESHYAFVPRGFRVPWGDGALLLALLTETSLPAGQEYDEALR